MSRKHNYPKKRKKRDCSYALSYKIYQKIGKENLQELFGQNGMYKAAGKLTEMMGVPVTPNVVNYLRKRYKFDEKPEV